MAKSGRPASKSSKGGVPPEVTPNQFCQLVAEWSGKLAAGGRQFCNDDETVLLIQHLKQLSESIPEVWNVKITATRRSGRRRQEQDEIV